MASPSASSTSSQLTKSTKSTKPTTVSAKRSKAYDANFRQHCKDHGIYPPFCKFPDGRRPPKPANLGRNSASSKGSKGGLFSPSVASETVFEDFQYKNTTKSEGTVMRNIIPLIAGDDDIPNEGHLPFTNLASITADTTVNPYPDFFDGAHREAVDQAVREPLDTVIISTKKEGVPIAPNLFLEAKGPGGTLDVAEGQCHAGWRLWNHYHACLAELPSGYAGVRWQCLRVFSNLPLRISEFICPLRNPNPNPSPRAGLGQGPSYHIYQINAYALTGNHEAWLEGIAAFRNMRRLAKKKKNTATDS